jgi:hypothetical protein
MEYFTGTNFSNCCIQILYKMRGEGGTPASGPWLAGVSRHPFQNVITNPPTTIKLPPTRMGALGD